VIDQGGGPTDLKRFFRKRALASRYFAKSMKRRHGLAAAGDACVNCGEMALMIAEVDWKATAKPRSFVLTLSSETGIAYKTVHPVCFGCADKWGRACRRIGLALRFVGWANWGWIVVLFGPMVLNRLGYGRIVGSLYMIWIPLWIACLLGGKVLGAWYGSSSPSRSSPAGPAGRRTRRAPPSARAGRAI
jgi:hypothetical protein